MNTIRDDNMKLPFDTVDVTLTINQLANKAPGPAKIRKPYFTHLPPNIIKNLTHLVNSSYATGLYPDQFKTAEIILIPKDTGEKT